MPQHIGIVAVSPEGAALFYQNVTRLAARMFPPDQHPRISLHNEPLALYVDAIRHDDWHTVGKLLRRSADNLARCGADFCLTPDHAVQHGVYLAEAGSPIPWLRMTELVAQAVVSDGRRTVGIVGTKIVTRASTYQTALGLRGVHLIAPDEHEADALDHIIFGELIFGRVTPESQRVFLDIINRLAARGCEGVILGCSEAPLVVNAQNSALPLYDPSELLAVGAVRQAMTLMQTS